MAAEERRGQLLALLKESGAISGSELAKRFGVTRQIVVQDIAILRAEGAEILSTTRGYQYKALGENGPSMNLVCRHSREEIEDELRTIISAGGRVRTVSVEHPVYGLIQTPLIVESESDLSGFLQDVKSRGAEPLSALTDGLHTHRVEARSREVLEQVKDALRQKGYLVE